ncbi:MAG: GrpB family protein [bacterium]
MALGLQRGKVQLADYNPEWAELFQIEKAAIQNALGDTTVETEHIGSTAIPGMTAKPIMDLMVAVSSIDDFEQFTPALEKVGYKFMRDNRDELEHVLYVKGSEENRTHYLKLTTVDTGFWREHIMFRDYLIDHPDRAMLYADLKQHLLDKHSGERENYTEEKEEFIQETLRLASGK